MSATIAATAAISHRLRPKSRVYDGDRLTTRVLEAGLNRTHSVPYSRYAFLHCPLRGSVDGAAWNREYSLKMLDECIRPIWLDEAIQFWSG
uniref:Uncharacterized protein n=1 Tax=Oryza sativa subsp. japonica TaxID=39947 RepID=Q338A8_ORYSJ|nr:hypothetical protein LOC_Os10g28430 [Oryza sativa Japonica Group]